VTCTAPPADGGALVDPDERIAVANVGVLPGKSRRARYCYCAAALPDWACLSVPTMESMMVLVVWSGMLVIISMT